MKKMWNAMLALVMTVLCSVMMVQTCFAAELPAVTIPAQITLSGTLPEPAEDYVIKMEADHKEDTPMPVGAQNGIYSLTINGEGSGEFPVITFERVGVYTYKIWQEAGTNSKCTYDNTVYTMTVYVVNAENGSGLEATAVLYPDMESNKQSGATFKNEYEIETEAETETETETESETETEKETEKQSETTTAKAAPKTGDTTPIARWIGVLAGAAVVLAALLWSRRKNSEK